MRGRGRAAAHADDAAFRILPLERLEQEAELVVRQVGVLLECAREQYRRLQDADVETDDGADVGLYYSRLMLARSDVAEIARQFTRAHASLVHRTDPRYNAARQVIGYCDQADTWAGRARTAA